MKSFECWAKETSANSNPWLVIGKGPTLGKVSDFDISDYMVLGLNHVMREIPVDVAHAIDLDVIEDCAENILNNSYIVVMPWHPHVNNKPSRMTLKDYTENSQVLAKLQSESRLYFYNHSLARNHYPGVGVIDVRYFSAEAAIKLLVQIGVSKIRTLGVDGGNSYSHRFHDLNEKTLLANKRSSFDLQFKEFSRTILDSGVDLAPLDVQSPIKVFVATTEAQMLAVKVLEYSIKKYCSMSSEVIPLHTVGINPPLPKEEKNYPRTPFSFQRFYIPQACDYQGRAIYLDSDMQVFKDIKQLWTLEFAGADVLAAREPGESGRRPQFSVMLLDCESLEWDTSGIIAELDSDKLSYEDLMYHMSIARKVDAAIDPSWNSLEKYEEGVTALLHYTDMNTQPWISQKNPLGYLWFRDLFEAIESGFITEDYIKHHVDQGWVRPSLWYQVENRLEDSLLLPRQARKLDTNYRAPYMGLHKHGATPWKNPKAKVMAVARHLAKRAGLLKLRARLRQIIER